MPRRLVIASDPVQHTQAMSFYRRLPAARDLERNERYQDLRVPLSGDRHSLPEAGRRD